MRHDPSSEMELVDYQKQEAARLWPILRPVVGDTLTREALVWHIEVQGIIIFPAPAAVLLASIQDLEGERTLCVVSAGEPDQLSDLIPFAEVCARNSNCPQIVVGVPSDLVSELHGYDALRLPTPTASGDLVNVRRRLEGIEP